VSGYPVRQHIPPCAFCNRKPFGGWRTDRLANEMTLMAASRCATTPSGKSFNATRGVTFAEPDVNSEIRGQRRAFEAKLDRDIRLDRGVAEFRVEKQNRAAIQQQVL